MLTNMAYQKKNHLHLVILWSILHLCFAWWKFVLECGVFKFENVLCFGMFYEKKAEC